MPTISRFYGIVVQMFYAQSEHNPPHIHAFYNEYAAALAIKDGSVLSGSLPPKAMSLVREWLDLHRDEVMTFWETQSFSMLPPLE